jgi:hypothetical protein
MSSYYSLSDLDEAKTIFDVEYSDCMQSCGNKKICRASCRNSILGTIPEDCAEKTECGYPTLLDMNCIRSKANDFHNCCIQKCKRTEWSEVPSINRLFRNDTNIVDCKKYCDNALNVIMF